MNTILLEKTYFIEVPIRQGSTNQQIKFPQINNLDRTTTSNICSYIPEVIPLSPSGYILANSNLLAVSYLTLIVGDMNYVWNLPILDLVTLNPQVATGIAANQFRTVLNNLPIIWNKCYVQIADVAQVSAVQDEAFVFNISYKNQR